GCFHKRAGSFEALPCSAERRPSRPMIPRGRLSKECGRLTKASVTEPGIGKLVPQVGIEKRVVIWRLTKVLDDLSRSVYISGSRIRKRQFTSKAWIILKREAPFELIDCHGNVIEREGGIRKPRVDRGLVGGSRQGLRESVTGLTRSIQGCVDVTELTE